MGLEFQQSACQSLERVQNINLHDKSAWDRGGTTMSSCNTARQHQCMSLIMTVTAHKHTETLEIPRSAIVAQPVYTEHHFCYMFLQ